FEVEHITPQSRGGETTENNLALSCRSCNLYKADSVTAFDDTTQTTVRWFHPRRDVWSEHFCARPRGRRGPRLNRYRTRHHLPVADEQRGSGRGSQPVASTRLHILNLVCQWSAN
ncbi:MAG: HNH endonuclease, partial [Pyrinomonadaceae bacterium]